MLMSDYNFLSYLKLNTKREQYDYKFIQLYSWLDYFHTNFRLYKIYKFDPVYNDSPWVQTHLMSKGEENLMLLDNLIYIQNERDESLAFRRSCREGICGSCAMNINGENTLACTYMMANTNSLVITVFPLPHMPVIKDLIVSLEHFYKQYKSINPFLQKFNLKVLLKNFKHRNHNNKNIYINVYDPTKENYQSRSDRTLLNGLYECILCACCSTSCPSYWWSSHEYLGPAILLQSYRWIIDSRDDHSLIRLRSVKDTMKLGRCHNILNCVSCCPKGLNPAEAISNIKKLIETNGI